MIRKCHSNGQTKQTCSSFAALDWRNIITIATEDHSFIEFSHFFLSKYCGHSAGRLKCPLQSTNKRFLLNTLRSSGPQRHGADSGDGSATRRRSRSTSLDRKRDRSRSPFRDQTSKGGHTDHKHHQRDSCNNKDKRRDGDRERSYRHKDNREWRHGRDTCSRAKDWIKNVQKRNTASFTRTAPSTGRQSRTVHKLSGLPTYRDGTGVKTASVEITFICVLLLLMWFFYIFSDLFLSVSSLQ